MTLRLLLLLMGILLPASLSAQNYEDLMDRLAEAEVSDLADVLQQMVREPIAINRVSPDSVQRLWFLTPQQKHALADLVRRRSPTISLSDLATALGWPPETVQVLFHIDRLPRQQLWNRLQWRRASGGDQYATRLRYQAGRLALGLTTERDAGEPRWLDFTSGYVHWQARHSNIEWLVGDFTLETAAGLAFSGPYGQPGLSLPKYAIRFSQPRFRPFSSLLENTAFRGVAVQWRSSSVLALGFVSSARRDAVLDSLGRVRSRPIDGLHRTIRERAAARTLQETTAGWLIQWQPLANLQAGLLGYRQAFNRLFINPDTLRKRFAFAGRRKRLDGLYVQWRWPALRLALFAEAARMEKATAWLGGLRQTGNHHDLIFAAWSTDAAFQNDHGALPGERTGNVSNQTGIYLGVELRTDPGRWTAYIHRTRTRWRTFFLPLPQPRQEMAIQWQRRLARGFWLSLRLRLRRQTEKSAIISLDQQPPGEILVASERQSLRLRLRTRITPRWTYRFGVDGLRLLKPGQSSRLGFAQYHALHFDLATRLKLQLKWTDFLADDYDSRVYQFDALFPNWIQPVALYQEGQRILITLRFRPGADVRLSGYWLAEKRVNGHQKNEFGLQLQWQK